MLGHSEPATSAWKSRVLRSKKRKPEVIVTPSAGAVENKWDEDKHELNQILSHEEGAVEVDFGL